MDQLRNIYESGRTRRYHANPQMAPLGQTVADHTWGMLALLFALNPHPSADLVKAITYHDSHGRWIGDVPYPFKRRAPELCQAHEEIGDQIALEMGIPLPEDLDEIDTKWLRLLDRLEAYLFAELHGMLNADWRANNSVLVDLALKLGVEDKIEPLIQKGTLQ